MAPLLEDINDKDSLKFDDTAKANILQTQFSSIFTNEPDGEIPEMLPKSKASIHNLVVTEEMVLSKLKEINTNKSCGPDSMHPRILKELSNYIAKPIAAIFNASLQQGTLPHDWKLANISPIYKKGSRNIAENYRPISLTSILCKIMESCIRDEILLHLQVNNLLSTRQYGFLHGRSTVTQLLNYLDKCANVIADGGVVDSIYLDFAKAFDTVPHRRLINKLKAYGISGQILNWITEYLHQREQVVMVNGPIRLQ